MKKSEIVSVVLPIYNVEHYLERCIESVVNQTYTNLEIILVDDGSPDKCPEICDKWSEKDSRIKVIHKQNEGLGMARNTGIENATGEYICFFDSDDYIAENTIEKAVSNAINYQADIVIWGFKNVSDTGLIKETIVPVSEKTYFKGEDIQTKFLPALLSQNKNNREVSSLFVSAWTCMISVDKIREIGWKFISEREVISEDVYSFLFLYRYVDCVAIVKEPLYYYCEHDGSLTHAYREDRYDKIKYFYYMCYKACQDLEYSSDVREAIKFPFLSNSIAALKMVARAKMSMTSRLKTIRCILKDDLMQEIVGTIDTRNETRKRKFLFGLMKHKSSLMIYILFRIKR